jgi:hypothetical protein
MLHLNKPTLGIAKQKPYSPLPIIRTQVGERNLFLIQEQLSALKGRTFTTKLAINLVCTLPYKKSKSSPGTAMQALRGRVIITPNHS